ncbi:hypothetical protein AAVH_07207 [Aphelenchoides avenae]|nr:hypothetical protein AAVH_07207 [Aphelenchus avenae]
MNSGVYFFVVNGVPKDWTPEGQKFMVAIWMFILSTTCMVSPVEFIFRYFLVVKNFTMGYKHVFYMACVVVLLSLNNSVLVFLAITRVEDDNAAHNQLMSDAIWWHEGYRPPVYSATKVRT